MYHANKETIFTLFLPYLYKETILKDSLELMKLTFSPLGTYYPKFIIGKMDLFVSQLEVT